MGPKNRDHGTRPGDGTKGRDQVLQYAQAMRLGFHDVYTKCFFKESFPYHSVITILINLDLNVTAKCQKGCKLTFHR